MWHGQCGNYQWGNNAPCLSFQHDTVYVPMGDVRRPQCMYQWVMWEDHSVCTNGWCEKTTVYVPMGDVRRPQCMSQWVMWEGQYFWLNSAYKCMVPRK